MTDQFKQLKKNLCETLKILNEARTLNHSGAMDFLVKNHKEARMDLHDTAVKHGWNYNDINSAKSPGKEDRQSSVSYTSNHPRHKNKALVISHYETPGLGTTNDYQIKFKSGHVQRGVTAQELSDHLEPKGYY